MNIGSIYSVVNTLRDRYAPVSHTSTFRDTGEITPEEFVAAGDYLVGKFPTWSWADADPESKRASHLPPGKQFLVTRNVPCYRRLNDNFAGDAGVEDTLVADGDDFGGGGERGAGASAGGGDGGDDDGWLRTGAGSSSASTGAAATGAKQAAMAKEVRTVDDAGNAGERAQGDDDEDDIPDMEDEEDDEAIIRDVDPSGQSGRRTYNLYIMYSPYYRTPRVYLSGYLSNGQPLPPQHMMEDIMGDYKDKTVTLEDFPFFANAVKMASVHPCKHAPVMKSLLDRADAALQVRREKLRAAKEKEKKEAEEEEAKRGGVEGLVEGVGKLDVSSGGEGATATSSGGESKDEWEDIQHGDVDDLEEVAIRVDQYLVVFLKFIASVTPGIEHDFTMAM